ncbi:MAG: formyltransferase family protein [Deltaproteobacteria bacterium]|nr:formyltransferase family protein [Deltaproteobacteria bacterium]
MKILFLGYPDSSLIPFLKSFGDTVTVVESDKKIAPEWVRSNGFDFLLSYGYLHILKKDILGQFSGRAINLHIALLPWNRGKDPNFWSFVEGSPKGVTIHLLDEGVDTGDILVQKEISFSNHETLRSSYAILRNEIEKLFFQNWEKIRSLACTVTKQSDGGSFHKASEKESLLHLLTEGWETPVRNLIAYGQKNENYLVLGNRPWSVKTFEETLKNWSGRWHFIGTKEGLTLEAVEKIKPKYLFFLHWSWIVPKEILNRFECVCFHMTDLPFGRGGTPLQNLILQGFERTKLSAFRMTSEVDGGPIYMKEALSLEGNADAIYHRSNLLSAQMIGRLVAENPKPVDQTGEVVHFRRRKPEESALPFLSSAKEFYNFIRMLDAEGYPKAFADFGPFRFEWSGAVLKDGVLEADVNFKLKETQK